ncbi:unnamed protein product [Acidithrix sp. C25]|nr:unnamed protein product [Acidithrix sp. C25]
MDRGHSTPKGRSFIEMAPFDSGDPPLVDFEGLEITSCLQ